MRARVHRLDLGIPGSSSNREVREYLRGDVRDGKGGGEAKLFLLTIAKP